MQTPELWQGDRSKTWDVCYILLYTLMQCMCIYIYIDIITIIVIGIIIIIVVAIITIISYTDVWYMHRFIVNIHIKCVQFEYAPKDVRVYTCWYICIYNHVTTIQNIKPIWLYTIKYVYIQSHRVICNHMQTCAIMYNHIQSYATIYKDLQSYA